MTLLDMAKDFTKAMTQGKGLTRTSAHYYNGGARVNDGALGHAG